MGELDTQQAHERQTDPLPLPIRRSNDHVDGVLVLLAPIDSGARSHSHEISQTPSATLSSPRVGTNPGSSVSPSWMVQRTIVLILRSCVERSCIPRASFPSPFLLFPMQRRRTWDGTVRLEIEKVRVGVRRLRIGHDSSKTRLCPG